MRDIWDPLEMLHEAVAEIERERCLRGGSLGLLSLLRCAATEIAELRARVAELETAWNQDRDEWTNQTKWWRARIAELEREREEERVVTRLAAAVTVCALAEGWHRACHILQPTGLCGSDVCWLFEVCDNGRPVPAWGRVNHAFPAILRIEGAGEGDDQELARCD